MGDLDQKAVGAAPPDLRTDRLDSWKEIALFLKREVGTVQRWEKQEALPVHRHMHGERGTVYAYKSEVAEWWKSRRLKLESQGQAPSRPAEARINGEAQVENNNSVQRSVPLWAKRAFGGLTIAILVAATLFLLRVKGHSQPVLLPATHLVSVIEATASVDGGPGIDVRAGDVNGDGIADAVVLRNSSGEAGIFFGGKFRATASIVNDADVLIREEQGHPLMLMGMADINGDGLQDLIFAVDLGEPKSFTASGPILVVFGRRQWKRTIQLPADADLTISIPVSYNASPHLAANAGHADLNGDGIDDLIFTLNDYCPPGRASAGAVFVSWGRRNWPARLDISAADVTVLGREKGDGIYDVSVGDVNGDGKQDLLVFAASNTLWNLRERHGHVYGFLGREHFPRVLDAAKDYDFRIDGTQPDDHLTNMTVADINGDGRQDVIVSAKIDLKSKVSRVLVFYGRKTWQHDSPITNPDWQITSQDSGAQIGPRILARDFEGDGADDLILCTKSGADDQLRFFHGGADRRGTTSINDTDLMLRVGNASDGICAWDSSATLFDAGRAPQILVAAPEASVSGHPQVGKAFIFAPYTPIKIDIRPGGYPNPVTPGSDGVVAVAILREDGLEPKLVDVSTLRLAGVPPISTNFCDYAGRNQDALCVYFESKNIRLKLSDRIAILTGKLKDGTPIYGSDSVLVLPLPPSPAK